MIRSDHEKVLDEYPEIVAEAKKQWRKSRADREKLEAEMYLKFRSENKDLTGSEIKAMVMASKDRYDAIMVEAAFEKTFEAALETLRVHKADARNSF